MKRSIDFIKSLCGVLTAGRILVLALLVFQSLSLAAVTAFWVVPPAYDGIERMDYGIFKYKKGSRYGLLKPESRTLVIPAEYDSITPFVDGYALLLGPKAGDGMILRAIVDSNFNKVDLRQQLVVEDYPFFSDNRLPVRVYDYSESEGKQKGKADKYFYIDPSGNPAIETSYLDIHPFSEGYAVVMKPSKKFLGFIPSGLFKKSSVTMTYIDRHGNELALAKRIGDICMGTTFKNGVALVENKKNRFFLINTQGDIVKEYGEMPTFGLDERYAVTDDDEVEGAEQDAPASVLTNTSNGADIFEEKGVYGYREATGVLLPAQFKVAHPFVDDYAIAQDADGKWGVLTTTSGWFDCTMTAMKKSVASSGKKKRKKTIVENVCRVDVPKGWQNVSLILEVSDQGNNQVYELPAESGSTRTAVLEKKPVNPSLLLRTKDLLLWRSEAAAKEPVKEEKVSAASVGISISPERAKADINDNATISVTVRNMSGASMSTVVKITGPGLKTVSKSVRLAPNGKKTLYATFPKVTKTETRTVRVTAGGSVATKNIKVVPFFIKL